ncbi:hypothetical protein QQS21_006116 [Conoideocrella luteorostrata]|uniref:Uncharacterized protein n=1 Tax=Conoideocrella luteorostrata TaxID=1105319 RepID=A0AAJ0FT73_9HYPO|nr:hypothetical protein QQS21_006116 [Conoideocrella luteorostrata]
MAKLLVVPSLLALSVAAAAPLIEFEYYGATNCQTVGDVSAVLIAQQGKCYDLGGAGLAFHIGGPQSNAQVPSGCIVRGFADDACEGGVNVQVQGPSTETQCYVVGSNMGYQYPVKSVLLTC